MNVRSALVTFLLVACVFFAVPHESAAESQSDLAIIGNRTSGVLDITTRELRSILLGERDRWPDGQKVLATSLPLETPETRLLLKQICGMSEGDYKRYFLQLAFQGKAVLPPRIVPSAAAVRALVSATPGALGIIRVHDVTDAVNIISLDGFRPGASRYKLSVNR